MAIHEVVEMPSLLEHVVIDTNQDAVVIEGVSKSFKKARPLLRLLWKREEKKDAGREVIAVDNVTLTVRRREIVGILGSNGSGKSTLIRILSTLLLPDTGYVTIFGYDVVKDAHIVQRLINRVSVEASFFKKLSPMENLIYAARLYNMSTREARRRITEILIRLGIKADRIKAPLENMSRGMQQKVAIARAFLTSPIVLLLDEPTTGLDPLSRRSLWELLRRVRRESDTTIFLTTQYLEEADSLCDRIAILRAGALVAEDSPSGLKRRMRRDVIELEPQDPRLADRLLAVVRQRQPQAMRDRHLVRLAVADGAAAAEDLLAAARQAGIQLAGLRVAPPSLDDVFLELTGALDPDHLTASGG